MKGFFFNLSTPDFGRKLISLYCTWLLASIDEHVVGGGLGGVGLEAHDVVRQVSVQPAQDYCHIQYCYYWFHDKKAQLAVLWILN